MARRLKRKTYFSKELAQGMGASGQLARYRLCAPSLLPEAACALYSQGRLSPSLALTAWHGMVNLDDMMYL